MGRLFLLAANLIVVTHFAFIGFVILGGFIAIRWRRIAFFHFPTAIWGALIEFYGWVCPLTPLEKLLRKAGGGTEYSGGFIEHYIISPIYPPGLTREVQIVLGSLVVVINLVAYGWFFICRKDR